MRVIMVVCAAFGLTISEAKTEITRLRAKGMPDVRVHFLNRIICEGVDIGIDVLLTGEWI